MKKRESFVSNSSSSSFVLIGEKIPSYTLTIDDLKHNVWVIGPLLVEGVDVFQINDKAMLKFVQDFSDSFKTYRNAVIGEEGSEVKITQELAAIGAVAIGGTLDQDSSGSIDELIEHYNHLIKDKIIEYAEEQYKS